MKLAKIKARYLNDFEDTDWLDIEKDITLFMTGDPATISPFFKLIERVNPLSTNQSSFDCPKYVKKSGYNKRVQPDKTTTAYSLFTGDSELAKLLGELEPALYELDKIEVGRRLDDSRWLSFVEIGQSARWRDIKESLCKILKCIDESSEENCKILSLPSGERLRRETGDLVRAYLNKLDSFVPQSQKDLLEEVVYTANKDKRFEQAIEKTYIHLPHFLYLTVDEFEDLEISTMPSGPMVLLVDGSSVANISDHLRIYKSLKNLGGTTQVLYAVKNRDNFPLNDRKLAYWYELEENDQKLIKIRRKNCTE